jgi:N-methylhydantoinase B
MSVARVDPVTFEIIRHKLNEVIDEAVFALKNVSGSPTTNEAHDLMVSLYRADGALMVGGVGYLQHLTSAAQAVKHIISLFGADPGIGEGDVYMLNDPYTAALHPPDVYIISPIHFDGELRGFVSNFVHVTDIGATDPGGFSPNADSCYQEGFSTPGLKLFDRGEPRQDVIDTFLNHVREREMVALDLKSQLAANHVATERMQKLFRDFKPDVVDAVSEGMIEQSQRLFRERLLELPDGVWRTRQYFDMPDRVHRAELALVKQADKLTFDFTGTTEESRLGLNNSYWGTWGAVFSTIFPMLAWDLTWNEGLTHPVTLIAPEGTIVHCRRPAPMSVATVVMNLVVQNVAVSALSKLLDASPKYHSRATAVWNGWHCATHVVGGRRGEDELINYCTDSFAGSGGARAIGDGVDLGGELVNGVSRWANAETHELLMPVIFLHRRVVPGSFGAGFHRGGAGHEFAFTPHDADEDAVTLVVAGKGLGAPLTFGLAGGFPGSVASSLLCRDGNPRDLPEGFSAIRARELEVGYWGRYALHEGDIFYQRFPGGGGYGDPLERDPEAVAEDVILGIVSDASAQEHYGVELTVDGVVDPARTRTQRGALRAERIGAPVPEELWDAREVDPTGRRISRNLQLSSDGPQCTWCGGLIGSERNWKLNAAVGEAPVPGVGVTSTLIEGLFLRLYFCPTCGTQLEVEVGLRDDLPLHDEIHSWPTR